MVESVVENVRKVNLDGPKARLANSFCQIAWFEGVLFPNPAKDYLVAFKNKVQFKKKIS